MSEKSELTGVFQKRGKFNPAFKIRHFKLDKSSTRGVLGTIEYYSDSDRHKEKGSISIRSVDDVKPINEDKTFIIYDQILKRNYVIRGSGSGSPETDTKQLRDQIIQRLELYKGQNEAKQKDADDKRALQRKKMRQKPGD